VGCPTPAFTVCVNTAEVLPAKFASPLYLAVMECDPAVRVALETDATPPLRVAFPSDAEPSKNCTVPVAAEGATLAVNVTVCPPVEGFALEDNEVVVGRGAAAVTINVAVVVWVRLPLVPVTVKVYPPPGVVEPVVTVMVEDPGPVTEVGLKLALAPLGKPFALNATAAPKPPDGVTPMV
jgi:hypothetical protein